MNKAVRFGKNTLADKLFLLGETLLLLVSSFAASYLYSLYQPVDQEMAAINAVLFTGCVMLCALSVGLYDQKLREDTGGVLKRVVITLLLSGILLELVIFSIVPSLHLGLSYSLIAAFLSMITLTSFRMLFHYHDVTKISRRKVLILGSGERASIIERRMRRNVDKRNFEVHGFVFIDGDQLGHIPESKTIKFDYKTDLYEYAVDNDIEQLVIACDERRNMLPVEHLFKCKTRGIDVIEILDFIEQETGQIAVNLIYPSWVIYSNGFEMNHRFKTSLDHRLNALLAIVVLCLLWPLMLITALAIYLDDGRRTGASVFYKQIRIGIDGKPFPILKFRSMRPDAEKNGAKWASVNDDRVTKIGGFIRKYRIDELPQLFNIIMGDMGFVGPRPERPEFVEKLVKEIPYYNQRHNVKPGLTGWAQLKYPYGSTTEDAQEKLKFDLYYIKHRTLLLDLVILIRTVEIVLFGKGR
ncbi:MAG: TIGR03013 family PEP-CTERM/XrtA system glycosyltransferase [Gammaproteobacteria bacterium]|jgi:sugar transferase (PEP-CTERM system associated)|nr:TIGR03013 family PEP-CTERM/XrtA system glycosyltransferase [Gammaproteobacteria bacterium]MBU2225014.1 TIGR03013 family PEP-CTERM/XrtA system glycosyltransferase [Gammaproteobacteria bacterium]MBU2310057.1 TIGR03013 family PEP-CTERM/XrtA system glycosyltransferase [Alphaproteobacteria bacterium]